jgi:Ulp1 family protease
MSKLEDNGPKAVAGWHKNINAFQKNLVFIPVHSDSHWLLCVIVNPGLIGNKFSNDEHPL